MDFAKDPTKVRGARDVKVLFLFFARFPDFFCFFFLLFLPLAVAFFSVLEAVTGRFFSPLLLLLLSVGGVLCRVWFFQGLVFAVGVS